MTDEQFERRRTTALNAVNTVRNQLTEDSLKNRIGKIYLDAVELEFRAARNNGQNHIERLDAAGAFGPNGEATTVASDGEPEQAGGV